MIKAIFIKENNKYSGFKIRGHANYAEYGKDIVCAAVSTLAINCINSIYELTEDKPAIKDCTQGNIEVELSKRSTDITNAFIASLELGLETIREQYGSKYITIK